LGSAAFNNAGDIANIFSRVTGSSISSIDGLISANGTANLFLINPNGIIFGENASLNLGGSFFASTADSLLFEGNTEFSASNPQAPPLLEVSIPIGANFRDNPGDIVNRSITPDPVTNTSVGLQVQPGKSISLIGGDVSLDGGVIYAPGGRIELGGLTATGTVGISSNGTLSFPEAIARGDISLSNQALVNVLGDVGGSIGVNANNLKMTGNSILKGGIRPTGLADSQSGDIVLNATNGIELDSSSIGNLAYIGNAGNIEVTTENLTLKGGAQLVSTTFGKGDAGDVIINAKERVSLDDGTILSTVEAGAEGNGGQIKIDTGSLNLTNGGYILAIVRQAENGFSAGKGNAGNVIVNARDTVTLDGTPSNGGFSSAIASNLNSGTVGKAGNVEVTTRNLTLTNGAEFLSSTFGKGDAGNVTVNATGTISLDNSYILSTVGEEAVGNGGEVKINTGSLALTNGAEISSSVFSQLNSGAEGKAGNIEITTGNLSLTNGSRLATSTLGKGDAGNVTVNAKDKVSLDGTSSNVGLGIGSAILSTVEAGAEGNGGEVKIDTGSLNLTNGGAILTIVRQAENGLSAGKGIGGNVIINARDAVTLDGKTPDGQFLSEIASDLGLGAVGKSGNIDITTRNLSLTNGSRLASTTVGKGDAGNITIKATGKVFLDNSTIFGTVEAGAEGNGGEVKIDTGSLNLTNGGAILTIVREAIDFRSPGQGNAGNVIINAQDSVTLDGKSSDSGLASKINSELKSGAVGKAGNIDITTGNLALTNGAELESSSSGIGDAGNVNITAKSLTLDESKILASITPSEFIQGQSNTGGNINLEIAEDILLRNNSSISALAGSNASGGNLTINADDGVIIAFPNQNNDITANATQGNGGNINITTQGIFGLEERSSTPPNQTNDIDASSEFGLQGTFSLNTPDVDPTTGLINLPASVGDASDQISQNPCQRGVGSEFIVTGKGGLPPNVNESLNSESAQVGLIETVTSQPQTVGENGDKPDGMAKSTTAAQTLRPNPSTTPEAVPAQGWVFNDKGEVTLTAYKTTNTEIKRSPPATNSSCSALSNLNQ
jgi:filamentous hemagglutinin family protein